MKLWLLCGQMWSHIDTGSAELNREIDTWAYTIQGNTLVLSCVYLYNQ